MLHEIFNNLLKLKFKNDLKNKQMFVYKYKLKLCRKEINYYKEHLCDKYF